MPLWALAGWRRRRGEGPLGRGISLGLACLVFALILLGVSADPANFIEFFSMGLAGLVLIKLFDRQGVRDQGVLLCMCSSLVVGSALLHSSLLIGVLLLMYLVLVFPCAVLLQIALAEHRGGQPAGVLEWGTVRLGLWPSAAVTSVVMVVVFVLMPRGFMSAPGMLAGPEARDVSGFSPDIELNTGGQIEGSYDPVLEVRAIGENAAFDRLDKLYIRGAVQESYFGGKQIASVQQELRPIQLINGVGELRPPDPLLTAEYEFTFIGREESLRLFTLGQTYTVRIEGARGVLLKANAETQEIMRQRGDFDRYTIEAELVPRAGEAGERMLPAVYRARIVEQARELLRSIDLQRDVEVRHSENDERIVRFFERYLRSSYRYTTNRVQPAPGEDPLEAFLFVHRSGHCEFFASSLCALARSVGIETRVVTGFLTTERTEDGAFLARNIHAHAWVEAHVSPGLWMRFDASPPGDVAQAHQAPSGPIVAVRSAWRWMSDLWVRSVVSYDGNTQSELLGETFNDAIDNATRKQPSLAAVGGWKGVLRAGALGGAAFAMVLVVGQLGPAVGGFFVGLSAPRGERARGTAHRGLRSELRRADRAMRRAGCEREIGVPARAHAQRLAAERPAVASLYDDLVLLHYGVRFGDRGVDEETRRAGRETLGLLLKALRENGA